MSKIYEALKKAETERSGRKKSDMDVERCTDQDGSAGSQKKLSILDTVDEAELTKEKSSRELVVLNSPKSLASEQFKKLRTKILSMTVGENGVFLITSPLPSEGKTFVVSNLGVSFALNPDTYALIIDADFRKPAIDSIFSIKYRYGLSDYLEGRAELGEIFCKTFIPRLSVIPAGHSNLQPSELLSSDRMKSFIKEVKKRYSDRFIFVDTTPMLLTSEPDILSAQVDGTLMVVGSGKSTQEDLKKSLSMLDRKKLWGIIFNKVNFKEVYHYKHYYRSH